MKRVKSACISQTLIFSQKEDRGYPLDKAMELNRQEVEDYKKGLERNNTKYQILELTENASEGYILVKVKKQYNDKIETGEYFN